MEAIRKTTLLDDGAIISALSYLHPDFFSVREREKKAKMFLSHWNWVSHTAGVTVSPQPQACGRGNNLEKK